MRYLVYGLLVIMLFNQLFYINNDPEPLDNIVMISYDLKSEKAFSKKIKKNKYKNHLQSLFCSINYIMAKIKNKMNTMSITKSSHKQSPSSTKK